MASVLLLLATRGCLLKMVFLGSDDPTVKDFLETNDLLPTLQAGVEAMLKQYTAEGADDKQHPINFLAEYLKRHNPRHNADFAAQIQQMRAIPGYGTAEFAPPSEVKSEAEAVVAEAVPSS